MYVVVFCLSHLPFSSVRMPASISHGTHGIWAVMRESLSREAVLSTHQSVTQSFLVIIEIQQHLTMSLCSRLHRWIHTDTSTLVLTHLTSVLYARLQRKSSLRSMKTCLAVTAVQRPMYIFHRFLTLLRVTTLQSESLVPVVLQQMQTRRLQSLSLTRFQTVPVSSSVSAECQTQQAHSSLSQTSRISVSTQRCMLTHSLTSQKPEKSQEQRKTSTVIVRLTDSVPEPRRCTITSMRILSS